MLPRGAIFDLRRAARDADFLHFPVADFKPPEQQALESLVLGLKRRVVAGEVIYIHCRGGHGRTGTVAIPLIAGRRDARMDHALSPSSLRDRRHLRQSSATRSALLRRPQPAAGSLCCDAGGQRAAPSQNAKLAARCKRSGHDRGCGGLLTVRFSSIAALATNYFGGWYDEANDVFNTRRRSLLSTPDPIVIGLFLPAGFLSLVAGVLEARTAPRQAAAQRAHRLRPRRRRRRRDANGGRVGTPWRPRCPPRRRRRVGWS